MIDEQQTAEENFERGAIFFFIIGIVFGIIVSIIYFYFTNLK